MILQQRLLAALSLLILPTTAISNNDAQQQQQQQPLASPQHPAPRWQLDFTSPAPHLFASSRALLQQWSNTVFPNGHGLAVVRVPAFTNLYHGRYDAGLPPSPEWLAFDM